MKTKLITWKTFRKYCKLSYWAHPYKCPTLVKQSKNKEEYKTVCNCSEKNCPVWKRLRSERRTLEYDSKGNQLNKDTNYHTTGYESLVCNKLFTKITKGRTTRFFVGNQTWWASFGKGNHFYKEITSERKL